LAIGFTENLKFVACARCLCRSLSPPGADEAYETTRVTRFDHDLHTGVAAAAGGRSAPVADQRRKLRSKPDDRKARDRTEWRRFGKFERAVSCKAPRERPRVATHFVDSTEVRALQAAEVRSAFALKITVPRLMPRLSLAQPLRPYFN